ncbi:MAG: D-glycero-beta-D-manno-heptose 1-phosphate adenylyltransferase [Methylophilaceae bacterium]
MKQANKDIIINKFNSKGKWALVIGDVMLDKYIFGEVNRTSPEAPVPVVEKKSESFRMGGAANVAANLIGLGIKTILSGVIGDDQNGEALKRLIKKNNISQQGLIKSTLSTTTKTRIIAGHQQIVRVDDEDTNISLSANQIKKILNLIIKKPSIIILSDYAKGFLTENLTQKIIKQAKKNDIPILVDPKGNDIKKYAGASILTPNKKEAFVLSNLVEPDEGLLEKQLKKICIKFDIENIAVTQGDQGIKLVSSRKIDVIPATKLKKVFDVSGAGDTVIATLAAGLIGKLTTHKSLELANIAAGVAIGKVGTVAIEGHEIINEIDTEQTLQIHKIISFNKLDGLIKNLRAKDLKIGFTNGCFDILHAGHVTYLEQAKNNIDFLILGLNSDSSVKKIKGAKRPIINQQDRARVLSSLEAVDAVIIFDEETPIKLIQRIKPNFLIKGSDYKLTEVVGHKEVAKWGGKVKLVELLAGRSSSNIIKDID